MVHPKNMPYQTNHLISCRGNSPEIVIGESTAEDIRVLEIFDKSLPLSTDLDRIPILRGIHIKPIMAPIITQKLVASGIYGIEITCQVWNGSTEARGEQVNFESSDLLGMCSVTVNLDDATPQAYCILNAQDFQATFAGGIVLKHKVEIEVDAFTAAIAVSGADFPEDNVVFDVILEIDWFPAAKSEIQNYINEMLYAERD